MAKKYFIILFVLLLRAFISAQSVTGKVTDSLNLPVQFAAIALIDKADSSIYKGVITNDSGVYFFNGLKPGNYIIKVKLQGYKIFYSDVFKSDSSSDLNLPLIKLRLSGISLNEISVSAIKKTVEFKNGNITVNVENSALATGNTAYDLLMRLPGVAVDQVNNSISVQGREGIKVLLDGRVQQLSDRQLVNLLKSISASSIEKIEVLKNPPIQYDAAGTAGMINIITKKVKLYGFSGNINTSASQGFYARGESGFSLNYKARKFTVFSNVNSEYGKYIFINNFNRRIIYNDEITNVDTKHTQTLFDRGVVANVGVDWFINNKNIIGVKLTLDPGNDNSKTIGNAFLSDSSTGFNRLEYNLSVPDKWNYSNYNFNAEHLLDTNGGKIKFSVDYSPNREQTDGFLDNRFFTGSNETLTAKTFKALSTETNNLFSSKLDLEKKITKTFMIKGGLKFSRQNLLRNYEIKNRNANTGDYIHDSVLSNTFSYLENIGAGYFQLEKEINDFNFQLGLRAENTLIHANAPGKDFALDRKYFNVFPLANIEFEPDDKHNFQLSYNQRINRPGYFSYIPYKNFPGNILLTELGNPSLRPEYSNTIEFTHTYRHTISNAVAYSRLSNYLMDYTIQNDSTKEITGYITNIKSSSTIGYTFFFETEIKSWWNISGNLMATYNSYSGKVNDVDYSSSGFGYSGLLTSIFIFQKDAKLEVEGQYIGPKPMGIFTIQPRWALNLAIKKSLFKNKLDVAVGINDLFYTLIGRNQVNYQDQKWKISETSDSRRVKVSLNYNFGKIKVEERKTSSNEEQREKLKH